MAWYFYNNRGVLRTDGLEDPLPVGLMTSLVSDDATPPVPDGWLLCDGSAHLTATYPQLAAILAYPAAPGASFNVPNMNYRFPVGTGSAPLKSVGGAVQHPHTISAHTHTNTHRHDMVTGHAHGAHHKHRAGNHTHGNTLSLAAEAGGQRIADDTGGGSTLSAKGPGSGASHTHGISGGVTNSSDVVADYMLVYSNANSAPVSSSSLAIGLQANASVISPVVDKLPPYLNVYCIIKAVDFSGGYI